MTKPAASNTPARTIGEITDEGLARLRERIGAYYRCGPYRLDVTVDDMRNHAINNGDWNPLYVDPGYGPSTRYGAMVAHPTYVDQILHYTVAGVGGLPGVHVFHSGNDISFFRSLHAGDTVGPTYRPCSVEEKSGEFAGRMAHVDMEIIYRNQRDEVVARAHGPGLRVVRKQARDRGKYAAQQKAPYTDEELEAIWAAYDGEEIRGDKPRYWEDVQVGEELPPLVRGPLRIVEIAFRGHAGGGRLTGAGGLSAGAHYYQFEEYIRRAGYAETHETTGVSDHPHRGHWEDGFARKIGVPGAYDVAVQRTAWMANLVTNWVGDHGWLARLWNQFRRFNVEGDATWVRGRVVRKWIEGRQHYVELEIAGTNQRGEVSTPGGAWAVLPSRHPGAFVPK